ncbi:hypothetical protein [Actinoplanes sp. NPDC051494]|uniref:hypothetical protein n=1 Tax=Actinoplanes sp. NPDC051494 TaxID=3363907 RepID=UPI0037B4A348
MDGDLVAALGPVLHDLGGLSGVLPEVRDEPWAGAPGTAGVMLYASDGSGMGVAVTLGQARSVQVAEVADQVQEWAVEALWMLGRPTNWPPCPHHPAAHPLAPMEEGGRAFWTCPVSVVQVCEIGDLAV